MYKNKTEQKLGKLLSNMKKRCKQLPMYYNNNIVVCEEWSKNPLSFISWALEQGYTKDSDLVIDRINTHKNYSPENCRFTTRQVNAQNRKIKASNNTSGYKGVHFHKHNNKYIATICINNILHHIGQYNTALEAAKAYDTYVLKQGTAHTTNNLVHTIEDEVAPTIHTYRKNNSSKTKGVDFNIRHKKWRARIVIDGRRIELGWFCTLKEATKVKQEFTEKLLVFVQDLRKKVIHDN